jgi:hypothetical protein
LNADLLDGQHGSYYTDFSNITVTSGEVTNTMLENSSVSLGGVSVSLGGTNATPAFDLQSATNYPGDSSLVTTGTVTTGVWNSTFGANANTIISGSITSFSSSLASRVSTAELELSNTLVSSSAQIASDISGSLGSNGAFIRGLDATKISGSLGSNASTIRTLTKAGISGSFTTLSSSLAERITHATSSISTLVTNNTGTNTGDVTLAGTPDYITISNQIITRNAIDLANDVTGALPLSNTALVAGTNITLDSNTLNVDDAFLINSGNDSTSGTITAAGFIATGNISGSVTATGSFGRIETAGNLVPKAHNTSDLGSSTNRWANIYSADLQLSNEDNEVGNEIDGTKGSWTIQEGEDDLYLLNRKNGKKYRFKLEEIT